MKTRRGTRILCPLALLLLLGACKSATTSGDVAVVYAIVYGRVLMSDSTPLTKALVTVSVYDQTTCADTLYVRKLGFTDSTGSYRILPVTSVRPRLTCLRVTTPNPLTATTTDSVVVSGTKVRIVAVGTGTAPDSVKVDVVVPN